MILLTAICDSVGNLTLESHQHIQFLYQERKDGLSECCFLEADEAAAKHRHSAALQGLRTQYFQRALHLFSVSKEKKNHQKSRYVASFSWVTGYKAINHTPDTVH